MAVSSKTKALGALNIPPIDNDPIFARESGLLAAFEAAVADIDAEVELLRLEHYLADGEQGLNRDALTWRRDILRREFQESENDRATTPIDGTAPPEVIAAIGVLRGANPEKPVDTRLEIEGLLERRAVIKAGQIVQAGIVDELRDLRSQEVAAALREQHRASLLQIYRAAQQLSGALIAEGEFRQLMVAGGYTPTYAAFPTPYLNALAVIGTESQFDSGIARFRRQIEDLGIL